MPDNYRLSSSITWVLWLVHASALAGSEPAVPKVHLRAATPIHMPHDVDCNTPSHWNGGKFYVFNSTGHPYRSYGADLLHLGTAEAVKFDNAVNGGRWIEATLRDDHGTLFGWYHNEPGGLCPGTTLTAPRIGALRSTDNGATWRDLGVMMTARPNTLRCDAQNGYFAGGHGDFSVALDANSEYLYFFFGNYAGDAKEQGVGVARMAWKDRDLPAGKVLKWNEGRFTQPGLGGRLAPIFPVATAWERADCDAFWGPSVHWNTYLKQYIMLLNRAKGKGWLQEGVYISYCRRLDDPRSWTTPQRIYMGGSWYPYVVGLEATGTDKIAGKTARFFMGKNSEWEIEFDLPTGR
jgi:hypothetical protein